MAKLIFLICILVALVHENVSEKSSESHTTKCKLCACVNEKKKLPALSTFPPTWRVPDLAYTICSMRDYTVINANITVNEENLTQFLSSSKDQTFSAIKETFRNCTRAAAAAAQANSTMDDIYVDVLKRLVVEIEGKKV